MLSVKQGSSSTPLLCFIIFPCALVQEELNVASWLRQSLPDHLGGQCSQNRGIEKSYHTAALVWESLVSCAVTACWWESETCGDKGWRAAIEVQDECLTNPA